MDLALSYCALKRLGGEVAEVVIRLVFRAKRVKFWPVSKARFRFSLMIKELTLKSHFATDGEE